MDIVFFRALAAFIKSEVSGVYVFIDEEVNREDKYPAVYMIDIDEEKEATGCGRVDYKERDGENNVILTGKMYDYKPTVRFTIVAPASDTKPGGEIVAELAKQIDHAFTALKKKLEKVTLVDPVSSDEIVLTYIKQLTLVSLPPDIGGEPVRYQRALTFRFTYQWNYEQSVEHIIKRVIVVYPDTQP